MLRFALTCDDAELAARRALLSPDELARAAAQLAGLGYQVKEMLGGMEYWIREGFGYETSQGPARSGPDALTAPLGVDDCGC